MIRGDRAQATTTPISAFAVVITAAVVFVVADSISGTMANTGPQQINYVCNGFWGCGAPSGASIAGLIGLLGVGVLGILLLVWNRSNREQLE